MIIKKSINVLLVVCLFSLSSCNTAINSSDTGTSSDVTATASSSVTSMTYPDDPIPDDYIKDEVMKDGEYGGRAYKDQLLLHLNGKEYIAVGHFSENNLMNIGENYGGVIRYTDDDLKTFNVGDEFVYDRDIRFTIKSLDVDEDWCHIDDYDRNNPQFLAGKIRIGDKYSLVHWSLDPEAYENGYIDDEGKLWILTDEDVINKVQDTRLRVVDSVLLLEYSDKCEFVLMFQGKMNTDGGLTKITKEQLSSVFDEHISSGRSFCQCDYIIRNNKVVKLILDVYDA